MKLVFIISIFLFSLVANAQSFAEEHYHFDVNYKMMQGYYHRGLYQEATQYVDSLKDNRYVNGQVYYLIARIYSLNNQFEKTLYYIEKAVERGITKKNVEKMYDLDKFRDSHLYIVFELNYDKWHQEYLSWASELAIDSVYYKEIMQLNKLAYKTRYKRVETIDGDQVFEEKDSLDLFEIEKQDSINFETLTELIMEKGFPTYKKVGEAAFDAIRMLEIKFIDGFNKVGSKWEKIKPLVKKEIELGNLKPFIYGEFEDSYNGVINQPLLYLHPIYTYKDYKTGFNKIVKPEELNIRRKSIGLCPIEIEYWWKAKELPLSLQEVKFK